MNKWQHPGETFPSEFAVTMGEHLNRFAALLPAGHRAAFYASAAGVAQAHHADVCLALDSMCAAAARAT